MIIDEPFPFESSCLMINALLLFLGDVFMKLGLKRFKIRFLHSADLHQSMLYHPNLDFVDIKENPRKNKGKLSQFSKQIKSAFEGKVQVFVCVCNREKNSDSRTGEVRGSRCVREETLQTIEKYQHRETQIKIFDVI